MRAVRLALLAALTLAGCGTTRSLSAAGDVHDLLVAVRDDDRPAFEAHVDRRALRAHLQARVVARARAMHGGGVVDALGVLMSGPAASIADSVLVRPEVFRAVAEYYGYRPGQAIPGPLALSTVLRNAPDGEICATAGRGGPCVLTFARETTVWRLVDIDPEAASAGGRTR